MQWIQSLKLMPKLMLTFGIVLLLMLVQGIVAYRGLNSLDNVTTDLVERRMTGLRTIGELSSKVGEYRNAFYQGLVRASDDVKADAKTRATELRGQIDETIASYSKQIDTPERRKLFDTFVTDWNATKASYDSVTELLDLDLPDDAVDTFVSDTRLLHRKTTASLGALSNDSNASAQAASEQAAATYTSSTAMTMATVVIGIGAGLLLAWLFARSLVGSMRSAVNAADEIANGKLDGIIDTRRADEVGDLLRAMQRMQRDLRERIERDQIIANENLRIRTALDYSSTGVYLTNPKLEIVYANRAVQETMDRYVEDLSHALPHYNTATPLMGKLVTELEPGGEISSNVLGTLDKTGVIKRDLTFGNAHFAQTVSVIRDNDASPWVMSWSGVTAPPKPWWKRKWPA